MLKGVIDHINTQLITLPGFDPVRVSGIAETVFDRKDDEPMEYPGIYGGNDTLNFVTRNDFKNGCIWHQKNGELQINPVEQVSRRNNILEYIQPMKVYAIHKRALIEDNSYSADVLAANITNKINFRNINSLRTTLNLLKIEVQATGNSTDKTELEQIFRNVDISNLKRYDIMYCSVSYNVIMKGRQECFNFYTC